MIGAAEKTSKPPFLLLNFFIAPFHLTKNKKYREHTYESENWKKKFLHHVDRTSHIYSYQLYPADGAYLASNRNYSISPGTFHGFSWQDFFPMPFWVSLPAPL